MKNDNSKGEDAPDQTREIEWIEAVENAMTAALSATRNVAELWPDVRRLIEEARRGADHPEALALYDTIKERQDCIVAETQKALDSAQRAIDAVKQADFETWLRRIRDNYRRVDPIIFADETKLELARKAQHVVETVPLEVARNVSRAHLDVYDLPQWHAEVLAAYLGRPTAVRRAVSAGKAILLAAAGDSVPYSGTVMEARRQLTPQIERELAAVPDQIKSYNRALYLRDAVGRLCELSRVVRKKIDTAPGSVDLANREFQKAASWLVAAMETDGS